MLSTVRSKVAFRSPCFQRTYRGCLRPYLCCGGSGADVVDFHTLEIFARNPNLKLALRCADSLMCTDATALAAASVQVQEGRRSSCAISTATSLTPSPQKRSSLRIHHAGRDTGVPTTAPASPAPQETLLRRSQKQGADAFSTGRTCARDDATKVSEYPLTSLGP